MNDTTRVDIRTGYLAGWATAEIAVVTGVAEADVETYLRWWCDRGCPGA